MLDLIKYIVGQFAEDKENVEYVVNEQDRVIEVTVILSMTKQERDNPSIIDSKRKRRIAAGSGTSVQEVNQLLKQFDQTKLLMKHLKGGKKGKMRLPF